MTGRLFFPQVLTSLTSCGSESILKNTLSHKFKTKQNKTKHDSGVRLHLFSMSVCTLWTKSLAIISTCGTSCRSAISDEREREREICHETGSRWVLGFFFFIFIVFVFAIGNVFLFGFTSLIFLHGSEKKFAKQALWEFLHTYTFLNN